MNEQMSRWGARVCGQNACSEVGGVRAVPQGRGKEDSWEGRRYRRVPKAPTVLRHLLILWACKTHCTDEETEPPSFAPQTHPSVSRPGAGAG